jgi:asparagine synthase (glutamine-hydrolysing)
VCGIAGILEVGRRSGGDELRRRARAMADAIAHRGPDASRVWADEAAGIAFGHRRLAIIELSDLGAQPMTSQDGRLVLGYNGEIYNFQELAAELRGSGVALRGRSDTEVLVESVARWGLEKTLGRVNGMFALSLWDAADRVLYLARDRLGEKPLYYGWLDDTLVFGSELKALCAHPAFAGEVDRAALALYLRHGYVPAPHSIYRGVHKLPPATYLAVPARRAPGEAAPVAYWSVDEVAARAARAPFPGPADEAVEELERRLERAIELRLIADVPLGAFLSGGIDSSTVVALMQRRSARPVRTFTVGFAEGRYDEAPHARAVAGHLGTSHTELYVSPREAMAVIPRLPAIYDEPFGDSSQIPTALVCALARQHVTVALSGDGGDELFGGYPRYAMAELLWRRLAPWPVGLRRLAAAAARRVPARVLAPLSWALPARFAPHVSPGSFGAQVHRAADLLGLDRPEAVYRGFMCQWPERTRLVVGAGRPAGPLDRPEDWPAVDDLGKRMMWADARSYLPDDILVKVDRASMAVSLEARVPLLDPAVLELAWSLPLAADGFRLGSKWPLRRVLLRHVPRGLVDRPKMGFGVPIDVWLRGPLREWASALLDARRLRDEGFLDPGPVAARWREHQRGLTDWQYALWPVLMFQAWLEAQRAPGGDGSGQGSG